MSTTIHDVARRAGVSISTVSRVLNDTCPVREDKRSLVLDAARALGYSPNPAALSLLNKKTGGLGVLLPFVSGEFFSEILSGLDEAAQENGLFLVISTSHRHPAEFQKAIQVLDKRVDGMIVMAPELDTLGMEQVAQTETPLTFINTYVGGLSADVFNFDNYGGAFEMTQHLLGMGHHRIALILGPQDAGDAKERARGYREAMAEAGHAAVDRLEVPGGYTREAGFAAAEVLLGLSPRPTAVIAANDYCGMGIVSALHAAGVSVPEDMAVGGFDGLTSSQYTVPPLSTIEVPIRDIGYRAASRLAARIRGEVAEDDVERQVVPVNLVIRESTALQEPAQRLPRGGGEAERGLS
jgi:LacI family transcriptional regulator